LLLGQFGQVVSMPANVLEQQGVSISVDPTTGALKSVNKK